MTVPMRNRPWIINFGRNVRFQPEAYFKPRSEHELLTILNQVKGRKIRVIGRSHAWSRGIVSNEVLIDIRHLNAVRLEQRGADRWAIIGGGCQVKRVLHELESQAGVTLPAVGLITEQTIAGASSTGTHGSGKHSISHYLDEVRIACYDAETGNAIIRTISQGPERQAARCALGCLGVVVSVGIRTVPQYFIEDHYRRYKTLDEVLATEDEFPAQQFYLLPWLWEYYVHERRIVPQQHKRFSNLYRWYMYIVFDVAFHLVIVILARWIPFRSWIRGFFRWIAPLTVIQNWRAIGKSQDMLTMKHDLFRHVELEVFVQRQHLAAALDYMKSVYQYLDGQETAISDTLRTQLQQLGLWETLASQQGRYTHHYHVTIRRVRPDDTLLSMSSGWSAPSYALSVICFANPSQRQKFMSMADFLAHSMVALFEGRPHWGKLCPLTADEANQLYPSLVQFREICHQVDSQGHFRNEWLNQVLFAEPTCSLPLIAPKS